MSNEDVGKMSVDERLRELGIELPGTRRTVRSRAVAWLRRRRDSVVKASYEARDRLHRSKHGWSENDVWELSWHGTQVLGGMLVHLANEGMSYPKDYPDRASWARDLTKYGLALQAYPGGDMDADPEMTRDREAAKDALRWVADNLDHLWD